MNVTIPNTESHQTNVIIRPVYVRKWIMSQWNRRKSNVIENGSAIRMHGKFLESSLSENVEKGGG